MKIFLQLLIVCMMFLTINVSAIELPEKTEQEKINLYLFYGKSCSYCHEFIEYFLDNYKEEYKDYFQIVAYETWYNDKNDYLVNDVKAKVGIYDEGVPFIIVGDKYYDGFMDEYGEDIIKSALTKYANKKYEDVVASVLAEKGYDVYKETLKSAAVTSGLLDKKEVTDDELYFEDNKIKNVKTSNNEIIKLDSQELEDDQSINYYFYSTIFLALTTIILSVILVKNKFFTKS